MATGRPFLSPFLSIGWALLLSHAATGCGGGGDTGDSGGGAGTPTNNSGGTSPTGGGGGGGTASGGQPQGQSGNSPTAGAPQGGQPPQGGAGGVSGGAGGVAGMAGTGGVVVAAGAGGTAGAGGGNGNPNAGCTDAVLRIDPPAGKESFKAAPVDNALAFSAHWIGTFGGSGNVGITGMADFDNDGDLDFASGRPGGDQQWWEYCSADHWVQHTVGSGHNSPGGGNAMDVDQDGWVDIIAGDSWYKNPATPREAEWQRYGIGIAGAEDIAVGDVSGDGVPDALWVINSIDPEWRTPGVDPTMPWPTGAAMPNRQQQGAAIGDVEGDGDNDILVGNQWWYRNGGGGTALDPVAIDNPFGDASPLATMGDIDGDGDLDFAMCTHFGGNAAWVENLDTQGTQWMLHPLGQGKAQLHSIFALDFDNDGDIDVMSIENNGNAYIWANDGAANFTEHTVASVATGHDARVGDVDCDGDLDVAGKPWDGSIEHVYLQNMTVENGGTALLQRPAGEVWHEVQTRMFCNLVLE